jgi:acetolactate synthase-1/2/3 large subunit
MINPRKRRSNSSSVKSEMTTGEAAVAALLAHGLDAIYALPGVHNDDFFDALHGVSDKLRVVHTRHEQGAAYMALGAALATGRPQAYSVVPGPGLLNSGAALLTAYSMNAPVLALIGQIPERTIGRGEGQLHEIRDQAGIIKRLVSFHAHIRGPDDAGPLIAKALREMKNGRRGPAAVDCAMDVWGKRGQITAVEPLPARRPRVDEDALRKAAKILGNAKRVLIVCGGGAQDASAEVNELSEMLQAPVLGYRRGRGVLDSRNPLSVTMPLGRELWSEADAVISVGSRMLYAQKLWGVDKALKIVRVDSNPEEPERVHRPDATLIGEAAEVLRQLLNVLPKHNRRRDARRKDLQERQAAWRKRLQDKLPTQLAYVDAIRSELPEDGIYVDEVTQIGFVARIAMPVYKPRTFLSPGYQDNLGWGYATALGAQHARNDLPVISINGDGGFLYTSNELATAVRHRIPLVAIVFADGAFGNVRRIQEERYGNRLIASDLTNPDFVKYAESFGVVAERARDPAQLRAALKRAITRREPALIEVPVGPMPSPWEFIHMPRIRGQ